MDTRGYVREYLRMFVASHGTDLLVPSDSRQYLLVSGRRRRPFVNGVISRLYRNCRLDTVRPVSGGPDVPLDYIIQPYRLASSRRMRDGKR